MPRRSAGILAKGASFVDVRGQVAESRHNDCCAVAMHAATQPSVASWRVRGQGRSRRCRPRIALAAQGGEAPPSGGAPRKLTPLPADFGERCVAGLPPRGTHTQAPRAVTDLGAWGAIGALQEREVTSRAVSIRADTAAFRFRSSV